MQQLWPLLLPPGEPQQASVRGNLSLPARPDSREPLSDLRLQPAGLLPSSEQLAAPAEAGPEELHRLGRREEGGATTEQELRQAEAEVGGGAQPGHLGLRPLLPGGGQAGLPLRQTRGGDCTLTALIFPNSILVSLGGVWRWWCGDPLSQDR